MKRNKKRRNKNGTSKTDVYLSFCTVAKKNEKKNGKLHVYFSRKQ